MLTQIIDETQIKMATLIKEEWGQYDTIAVVKNFASKIQVESDAKSISYSDQGLDVNELTAYLQRTRLITENKLKTYANVYSPLRWLWYIRRLPYEVFEGDIETTGPYDQILAEAVSSFSKYKSKDYLICDGQLQFELSPSVARRVLKFCGGVKYLSDLHSSLRLAGKGVISHSLNEFGLPEFSPTEEQTQTIARYDQRVAHRGSPFGTIGTLASIYDTSAHKKGFHDGDENFLHISFVKPKFGPSIFGPLMGEHTEVEVYTSYVPDLISFNALAQLNTDRRLMGIDWWPQDTPAILLLLSLAMPMMAHLHASFASVQQFGYLLIRKEAFFQQIDRFISPARKIVQDVLSYKAVPSTAQELLSILDNCKASLWPLRPRKPITILPTGIYLDLCSASVYLYRSLQFPNDTGEIANARSNHFELTTQELLDKSPWQPPDILRNYRGATLRYNGKSITDIDAIGAKQDTLLIVSCKSIVKTMSYDTGDYREVRNIKSTLEKAAEYWLEIKKFFLKNPIGDNYDFSNYKDIVQVVCTNDVFYTLAKSTHEIVTAGLVAVVTIKELTDWLYS